MLQINIIIKLNYKKSIMIKPVQRTVYIPSNIIKR